MMSFGRTSLALAVLAPAGALVFACGGETAKKPGTGSIEEALAYESKERAAAKAADEKAAAEAAAAKQRDAAEQTAKDAEIDALAVLPSPLPKDVPTACGQVVDAYETFMKTGNDAELVMNWYQGYRKKLAMRRQNCVKANNLQAAACMARALDAAPQSFKDIGDEGARQLFQRCDEKFGSVAVAGGKPGGGKSG